MRCSPHHGPAHNPRPALNTPSFSSPAHSQIPGELDQKVSKFDIISISESNTVAGRACVRLLSFFNFLSKRHRNVLLSKEYMQAGVLTLFEAFGLAWDSFPVLFTSLGIVKVCVLVCMALCYWFCLFLEGDGGKWGHITHHRPFRHNKYREQGHL